MVKMTVMTLLLIVSTGFLMVGFHKNGQVPPAFVTCERTIHWNKKYLYMILTHNKGWNKYWKMPKGIK